MAESEVEARWMRALEWYTALPMSRRKVEYTTTIRRALEILQTDTSLEALRTRYMAGVDWVTSIARDGFPDTPALWATERTADVAFGIRARQLLGMGQPPHP